MIEGGPPHREWLICHWSMHAFRGQMNVRGHETYQCTSFRIHPSSGAAWAHESARDVTGLLVRRVKHTLTKVVFPVPPSPTAYDHHNRAPASPHGICERETHENATIRGIDGVGEGVQMSGQ